MKIVTLSTAECRIAKFLGKQRREISLRYGRDTRRDFTENGLTNDIESTAAEMAVAKCLNIYPEWSPTEGEVPKFDLRFSTYKIDVKSTQMSDGNLLVPYLKENVIYYLVRGKMPTYEIVGWIHQYNIPSVGQWVETMPNQPCWLVPANKLEGG